MEQPFSEPAGNGVQEMKGLQYFHILRAQKGFG
jgi:hypothetical protein